MPPKLQRKASDLLGRAGIIINGNQPYDIQVHDPRMYTKVFSQGALGLGEAYMDGFWDCADLPGFIFRVQRSQLYKDVWSWQMIPYFLQAYLTNMQSRSRAGEVAQRHYDLGNNFYEGLLDSRMNYSCGYWERATNLEEAQEAKLDLICRKLGLKSGDHILDIGCGWGSLLKYAAQNYGISGVGVTISQEQVAYAQDSCKGLPIEIRLQDYRDTPGQFDRIVSVGMFEHVGAKNYDTFMARVYSLLKKDGLFLLHTIGSPWSVLTGDPWFHKYIFPNGMLPSVVQIGKATEHRFIVEDWHNFGANYDKTLLAWYANFERMWPKIKDTFDERFHRMWTYYLLSMAGSFRARHIQLWQIVLSKQGVVGGYKSIR